MAAVSEATNATADESVDSQVADPTLGTPEVADETIETGEGESEEPSGPTGDEGDGAGTEEPATVEPGEGGGSGEGDGDAGDATDLEGTTDLESATAGRPSGGDAEVDTEGLDEAMTLDAQIGTRASIDIKVSKGDVRTGLGAGAIGAKYAAGTRFGLFATDRATSALATCQIATGASSCVLSTTPEVASTHGNRLWVGEIAPATGSLAAANYLPATITNLVAGNSNNLPNGADNIQNRAYRYRTPDLSNSNFWTVALPQRNPTGVEENTALVLQKGAQQNFSAEWFYQQSSGRMANVLKNPPLTYADDNLCKPDFSIAVVMDLSNSVLPEKETYRVGTKSLVEALGAADHTVDLALYSFGTKSPREGTQNLPSIRLNTNGVTNAENVATAEARVDQYINAISPNTTGTFRQGLTNWDQALWKVSQDAAKYDVVLFITDGDPTVWGEAINPGSNTGTWPGVDPMMTSIAPSFRNIEYGIYSANAVKEKTRLVALGVKGRGTGLAPSLPNLAAISGPTKGDDYIDVDWADYKDKLLEWIASVAPEPCDAWITVKKETKGFDTMDDDFTPATDWRFDLSSDTLPEGTLLDPRDVSRLTAGADGSFTWKYTFEYRNQVVSGLSLTESAAPPGDHIANWDLSNIACVDKDGKTVAFTQDGLKANITPSLPVGQHYTCTFSNEQAGVQMNKYWTVNGTDYPVNQMPTALGTTWNATPTLTSAPTKPDATVAWGKAMGVYKTGDKVQVGETSVTEVAENLPGCKLTTSEIKGPGIGTGTAYVDLPLTSGTGSAEGTLAAGLNVYDLHNVVTCEQELTLIKQVDNVEGGVAKPVSAPADWTLTAAGPTDGVTGTTGDEAITGKSVAVGSYALSEAFDADAAADGTAYKQQAQWACTVTKTDGSTEGKTVTGTMPDASVNVGTGEHVTCRVVNETAELTVLKKVVGGKAQPSNWTLTATPEAAGLAKIEAPGALQPLGTGEDKNTILVKPGEKYILAEDEGSAAYFQTAFQKYVASESCSLTEINQDNDACWTDANADDVSVAALDRGIYRFVNTYVESPTLPQTGGQGAAFFAILGGGLLLGAGGLAALSRRRRVQA